tara:strand:+ start:1834 stop:1980 length:147 start_codon:yes stop_codon:yes gene_type:complete
MKEVNYDNEKNKNKLVRIIDALSSIDNWHYRRVAIMQSNKNFLENGGN